MQLDPSLLVMSINRSTSDVQYNINKINLITKNHPKVDTSIINAVVIYLYRRFNGKLPTYKYIKNTIKSFVEEYQCSDAEDAFDTLIYKINYELQVKEQKEQAKDNTIKKRSRETFEIRNEIDNALTKISDESVSDMLEKIMDHKNKNSK